MDTKEASPARSAAETVSNRHGTDQNCGSNPSNAGQASTPGDSKPVEKPLAFTIDLEPTVPKSRRSGPPLAFTVGLEEDADASPSSVKGKKFAMNASLSEFLPPKMKKSVKDRAAMIKKKDTVSSWCTCVSGCLCE